jgi:peptidoglycan/xylan/chitin deacetylase (PgdA/CDA1 family)
VWWRCRERDVIDLEELAVRREARRRRRRRRQRLRRAVAAGAVIAGAAALVLIVTGGGRSSRHTPAAQSARSSPARGHRERAARHATPTPTPTGRPVDVPVPILMYHVIGPAPPGARFPGLYVPPTEFAAQVRALKRAGWVGVTLDQVADAWEHGAWLPPGRPIVISFDNGYESHFNEAFPVLRRLGWVAVENLQLTGLPRSQGGLSTAATERLIDAGWELDTQGFRHADLVAIDARELRHEVAAARRVLRRRWHVPVNWFCYPSGHYDARAVTEIRAAGYRGSTTVVPGWARPSSDPFRLPRLRVLGGTSPAALQEQIASNRHAVPPPFAYGVSG